MAYGNFVGYYRVSTAQQGKSGLGLEAQKAAVYSYLNGGTWNLAAEIVEIESGKRNNRPKLAEALRLCRLHGATLIIAKLDRLARNVAFVSALMDFGVDFVAVDFPQANRLTIHILAAVAEHEAKCTSERTIAALAMSKKKLGGYRGVSPSDDDRDAARTKRNAVANARAADLAPVITELRAAGVTTLSGIARALTERNIPTATGGATWSATQVSRVLDRVG